MKEEGELLGLVSLLVGIAVWWLLWCQSKGHPLGRLALLGGKSRRRTPGQIISRALDGAAKGIAVRLFPRESKIGTGIIRRVLVAGALGVMATGFACLLEGGQGWKWAGLGGTLAGWYGPEWWRGRERGRRVREVAVSLPQLLDLMVVCAEAGLNLRGSLERAVAVVGGKWGEEVRVLLDAMSPARVMEELERKYRLAELGLLSAALRQGETLGLPANEMLRGLADQMREAMRQRAEAVIAAAPVKLSLCTACFFLPAALALTLAPQLLLFISRW